MSSTAAPTWRIRANYWRGWRAIGGHLTLDSQSLAFEPHGIDRATGGNTPYRARLGDIVSVEVARRGLAPRKSLYVRTRDDVEARFLVPHVTDRAAEVREATGRHQR